ncbi:MAG: hypothetical protein ABJP34_08220 [Erythrobacter sp.]
MRIFAGLSMAALGAFITGCSGEASPMPEGQTIECAIGAGVEMGPDCVGEQIAGGEIFVIHHPDGSFRRFEMLPDDAGIGLADGAGVLSQQMDGDELLISVDDARYRLPIAAETQKNGK